MIIAIRMGSKISNLTIWYNRAVEDVSTEALLLAKTAIRSYMHGERFCIGKINPNESYVEKNFKMILDEINDADIISYIKATAVDTRKAPKLVRTILLEMLEYTEGQSKLPTYTDAMTSGYGSMKPKTLNDVVVPKKEVAKSEPKQTVYKEIEEEKMEEIPQENSLSGFGLS